MEAGQLLKRFRFSVPPPYGLMPLPSAGFKCGQALGVVVESSEIEMDVGTLEGLGFPVRVTDPNLERGGVEDDVEDITTPDGNLIGQADHLLGVEFPGLLLQGWERSAAFVLVDDALQHVRGEFVGRIVVAPNAQAFGFGQDAMGEDFHGALFRFPIAEHKVVPFGLRLSLEDLEGTAQGGGVLQHGAEPGCEMRCAQGIGHFGTGRVAHFCEHNSRRVHAAIGSQHTRERRHDMGFAFVWQVDGQHGEFMGSGLQGPIEIACLVQVAVGRRRTPGGDAAARVRHQEW